jgi:hypothetical protein
LAFRIRSTTLLGDMTLVVLDGELMSAVAAKAGTAAVTKAVVASAVVLLPAVCVTPVVPVGREGVPVNAWESTAARVVSVPWT